MLNTLRKTVLSFILFFFASKALAVTAYYYKCPGRKNLTITRAQYRLNMIQWEGNFYVGVGDRKVRLEGKDYLHMIFFRNGDRYFYDDSYRKAFMIYGNSEKVWRCVLLSMEKIEVMKLPVYR
ncbi:hypothetical protein CRM79_01815 [Pantoea agglomerans]|nr:hypothetical protein [Pantoea agglomerans]PEI06016.1 hypothetical protein CRM79_01815 [Pantoea agglomerans]